MVAALQALCSAAYRDDALTDSFNGEFPSQDSSKISRCYPGFKIMDVVVNDIIVMNRNVSRYDRRMAAN